MGKLEIKCVRVGMLQTNCYIIYDDEIREAIVVDPGDEADYIAQCLKRCDVKAVAILLTHGHSDHFLGLTDLKKILQVPVYIPADDAFRLAFQSGFVDASYEIAPDDILVHDKESLSIGGMQIEVIHTPGHTEGGTCYYFREQAVLLSGDTMFCHSWGRTDFAGGDEAALFRSIREKLLPLPEDTVVLPGHEGTTTIREERRVHGYRG